MLWPNFHIKYVTKFVHDQIQVVVKQFTDIPINQGLLEEKNETGSNFTILVFLHYFIFSLMHQKVWSSPKNIRIRSYFSLQKDFQKRKLFIFFFFPPTAVSHVGLTFNPKTPIDSPGRP